MTALIFVLAVWGIAKACESVRQQAKQKEAERQRRLAILEREQIRLAREQERQAKEQEKLEREQARQAEQLAKHEERIAKIELQLEQAEAEIERQEVNTAELNALIDYYLLEQAGTTSGSKDFVKYQNKIISLENRVHTAEMKLAKAKHIKAEAERKLSA